MSAHPQDHLLAAYVDGSLSASHREAIEAHLGACEHCRAEVRLARGAHGALRGLSRELEPTVNIAGAVLARADAEASGADVSSPAVAASGRAAAAGPAHAAGSRKSSPAAPRWYRGAGLVAAAALVAIAVFAIPHLGGDADQGATTEAAGAPANASGADRVVVPTVRANEYDDVSLAALASREADQVRNGKLTYNSVQFAGGAHPSSSEAAGAEASDATSQADAVAAKDAAERATACVRTGSAHPVVAADAAPPEAPIVRIVNARFEGADAYLGTFLLGPSDVRTGVVVVAVATDDCRFLGSAEHGV